MTITLSSPCFDLENHIREISIYFFTDSSEYLSNKSAVNRFINELSTLLPTIKADVIESFGHLRNLRSDEPQLSSLWMKYSELARVKAKQLKLVVNKTSPAVTSYLAAVILSLWEVMAAQNALRFKSTADFLEAFKGEYDSLEEADINLYFHAANVMHVVFKLLKPTSNKTWVLQYLMSRLLLARPTRYKPGGGSKASTTGQNREFCDLCSIYERLGGVVPTEWSSKRRCLRRYTKGDAPATDSESEVEYSEHPKQLQQRRGTRRARHVSPTAVGPIGNTDTKVDYIDLYSGSGTAPADACNQSRPSSYIDDSPGEEAVLRPRKRIRLRLDDHQLQSGPPVSQIRPAQEDFRFACTIPGPPLREISSLSAFSSLDEDPAAAGPEAIPMFRNNTDNSIIQMNGGTSIAQVSPPLPPPQLQRQESGGSCLDSLCYSRSEGGSPCPSNGNGKGGAKSVRLEVGTPTSIAGPCYDSDTTTSEETPGFRSVSLMVPSNNRDSLLDMDMAVVPRPQPLSRGQSCPPGLLAAAQPDSHTQDRARTMHPAAESSSRPSETTTPAPTGDGGDKARSLRLRQLGFDTYFRPFEEPYLQLLQAACGGAKLTVGRADNSSVGGKLRMVHGSAAAQSDTCSEHKLSCD